jgi:hypothetical protein
MDALLLTGVCVGGFLILNNTKEKYTLEETEEKLNSHRANQYPVQNVDIMRNAIETIPAFPEPVNYSTGPLKTPLELKIKEDSNVDLLDMSKRPMRDFLNNNFIPNRNADTQNMNGTGVKMGNFRAEDYNMGGDPGQMMSRNDVGFGPGCDPTYMHKRESGPRFSPSENSQWIYGRPDIRPEQDRFKMDIRNKNYESPCEKIFYVGPGTGIDPSISASGGFNAGLNNRVLPNNIFNYQTNQLPGSVVKGKLYSAELPTANPGYGTNLDGNIYGVPNNKKPPTFWAYDQRPPVASGISALEAQTLPTSIKVPDNNRSTINTGFGTLVPHT